MLLLFSAGLLLPRQPAETQLTDQGNAATQFNLGVHYENGDGVPKDLGKARELYQKAADQGYADAQLNLGWLYENGEGVPKDLGKQQSFIKKRLTRETLGRRLISAGSTKTGGRAEGFRQSKRALSKSG